MTNTDCYQNNIIAVLENYFHIDYRPFFWTGFDFRTLIDKKLNSINITGYNNYQDQILFNQCGVKINCMAKPCIQEFKQLILKEIGKSKPLELRLNGSDMPWNYDNRNMEHHYLLVVGIDSQFSLLYCCDGFLNSEIQAIDVNFLYNKVEYMLVYSVLENYEIFFENSLNNFFDCLDYNSRTKENDLYLLVNSIITLFDKISVSDPNNNMIIFQLSRVCWSRYNFMKSLEYFSDKFMVDLFVNIIKYFGTLIDTWIKLKNLLIKSFIIGNNQQIYNHGEKLIKIIAEYENIIENEFKMLRR